MDRNSTNGGLADLAADAALSACLAAASVVPVLFDPRAARIFDEPKILVLQSLAVFAAVASGVRLFAGNHTISDVASRLSRARTIVMFLGILAAAYLASSVFSIAPRVAWHGGYLRRQGTFTFLSNVVFFLVVGFGFRTRREARWLVLAVVLASVAPAVYAICQRLGFDFVLWSNPAPDRVTSTAGNAIFLGSYLVMAWPVTLALAAQSRLRPIPLVLLTAQTLAIVFTGSVGVWLALAATVLVLLLILLSALSRFRTRVFVMAIALAVVGAVSGLAVSLRPIGGSTTSSSTAFSRPPSRTAELRLLLWRSAIERLRAHPIRSIVGYGPDTIRWTLGADQPAAVRRIEGPETADRSHNGSLDLLLTVGFPGFVGHILLFAAICVEALRGMGLIASRRDAFHLGLAVVLCLVGGVALADGVDPAGGLLPIAWGGGLAGGLLCFLGIRSFRTREALAPTADGVWLAALLAGLVGHYVASQTGIGTATSELYFWLYAGLIVAVRRSGIEALPARTAETSPQTGWPEAGLSGAVCGLLGAALMFDFGFRLVESASALALWGMLAGATVLMGLAVLPDQGTGTHRHRRPLVTFCAANLALWIVFIVVSFAGTWALTGFFGQPQVDLALSPNRGLGLIGALCATIMAACVVMMRAPRAASWPLRLVGPALACGALALFVAFNNARTLYADELSRVGAELAGARRWQPAEDFYARALVLAPNEDVYHASLGELRIAAARSEPGDQRARLASASGAYLAAHGLSPDEPGYLLQLAAVESLLAEPAMATAEGRRHLEAATQYLAAAAHIAPRDPELWNESGKVRLRQEDFASAIQAFRRSLSLDDRSAGTHLLYGDALVGAGRYSDALHEYETAQSLGLADPLPALSGSALAFVGLNRPAEAVEANKQALAVAPNDYTSLKNLALLYGQLGDLDQALSFAVAAADAASAADKPSVVEFIDGLRARMKNTTPKRP